MPVSLYDLLEQLQSCKAAAAACTYNGSGAAYYLMQALDACEGLIILTRYEPGRCRYWERERYFLARLLATIRGQAGPPISPLWQLSSCLWEPTPADPLPSSCQKQENQPGQGGPQP